MVVYIDSLIFTNIIIDYLLISLASLLTRRTYSLKRIIASSIIGGFSSLYIFVETTLVLDIFFQVVISSVVLFVSIGKCKFKNFVVSLCAFLGLSFTLNGAATLVSKFQKQDIVLTDNMIYYLNISPLTLLFTTAIIYVAILTVRRILDKKRENTRVTLKVNLGDNVFSFEGLVDTGNNISDPFLKSPVFIINADQFEFIKYTVKKEELALRQRVIPAKTIGEELLLNGIRCDKAVILENSGRYEYEKPIVVSAIEKIENDYDAIIPYAVLDRVSE